jgi:hypothetical protein
VVSGASKENNVGWGVGFVLAVIYVEANCTNFDAAQKMDSERVWLLAVRSDDF